jgi:hypothetical protein
VTLIGATGQDVESLTVANLLQASRIDGRVEDVPGRRTLSKMRKPSPSP